MRTNEPNKQHAAHLEVGHLEASHPCRERLSSGREHGQPRDHRIVGEGSIKRAKPSVDGLKNNTTKRNMV